MTYLAEAHADWHAVNGRYAICPLDCGAAEALEVPEHLAPEACFVCGWSGPHAPDSGHDYWSNADADREAREHDARVRVSGTPEARYVDEHRPY